MEPTKKRNAYEILIEEIKGHELELKRLKQQKFELFKQAESFCLKDVNTRIYFDQLILKLKEIIKGSDKKLKSQEISDLEDLNSFYFMALGSNLFPVQDIKDENFQKVLPFENPNYDELISHFEKKQFYHTEETDCFVKYSNGRPLYQKFTKALRKFPYSLRFNPKNFKIEITSNSSPEEIFKNVQEELPEDFEILKRLMVIQTKPNFSIVED